MMKPRPSGRFKYYIKWVYIWMGYLYLYLYLYLYWYDAETTAGAMRRGSAIGSVATCESWLEALNCIGTTAISSRAFQSWIVFTKKEFLYCWVFGFLVLKQFEWFIQNFSTMLELSLLGLNLGIILRLFNCYRCQIICTVNGRHHTPNYNVSWRGRLTWCSSGAVVVYQDRASLTFVGCYRPP